MPRMVIEVSALLQVAYLKEIWPTELAALEIGTVDGFQGTGL